MWGALLGPAISIVGSVVDRIAGQNPNGSSRLHTIDKLVMQVFGQMSGSVVATAAGANPLVEIETGLPPGIDLAVKGIGLLAMNLLAGEATWRVGISKAIAKRGRRPGPRTGLGRS